MQEGRKPNVGWSLHYDKYRDNLAMLYHTEEEEYRLCGSTCCNKADVLITHKDEKIVEKIWRGIIKEHNRHNNCEETREKRSLISKLQHELYNEHREVLDKATADLKETMLEYFI